MVIDSLHAHEPLIWDPLQLFCVCIDTLPAGQYSVEPFPSLRTYKSCQEKFKPTLILPGVRYISTALQSSGYGLAHS